jgi:hypothetical protein
MIRFASGLAADRTRGERLALLPTRERPQQVAEAVEIGDRV